MVLMDEQKFPSACGGHLISMNILAGQGILHLLLTIRRDIGPTYRHKIPNTLKVLKRRLLLSFLIYMRLGS
jgi:hypothetical protein